MKLFVYRLAGLGLAAASIGCAGLTGHPPGFTCMASQPDCSNYLRTGGVPEPSYQRPPDTDFTVINSNRGPMYIYRQGNIYWVNDKRR